ncbi:2-oxoacid:acceptor oxidoreductase family protein [Dethiobacter alkaliphilus]|uniref:Pyruvate/ketoisovalerate oxidoreductase, gamma subunit n=1 Tax=Dethiobacter alkaliphilus AHT 1 TaxID=555088 RepID=C0GFI8_DETAL|nr:2-oxoacid:acceptor oxidoreductase family protein [Dethiobacter alkaliphilus]EEG77948.1 pyruvate/ketoisovalerate oxidoreductase, gamma subunit [Dethiobacter alkaliphilus AHT 1]
MGSKVTEIRWHARGGQGAVTAAKMLAEMALSKDLYFQAFPEYGPERMGAPIQCFNRLSKEPIHMYCGVASPEIVIVVDPSLCDVVDFTAGLPKGSQIAINTGECPATVTEKYNLHDYKVSTVDATRISMDALGRAMPNVPMLGALLKLTGLLSEKEALSFIEDSFGHKFSAKVVKGNVTALQKAFEEVQTVE